MEIYICNVYEMIGPIAMGVEQTIELNTLAKGQVLGLGYSETFCRTTD